MSASSYEFVASKTQPETLWAGETCLANELSGDRRTLIGRPGTQRVLADRVKPTYVDPDYRYLHKPAFCFMDGLLITLMIVFLLLLGLGITWTIIYEIGSWNLADIVHHITGQRVR